MPIKNERDQSIYKVFMVALNSTCRSVVSADINHLEQGDIMKAMMTALVMGLSLGTASAVSADANTQQASAAMEHAAASIREAYALAPAEMTMHCGHALEQAAATYPGSLDIEAVKAALCSPDSEVNLRMMMLTVAKMLENS